MPDAPRSIFISYAHTDSPFVDRLEADLHTLYQESLVYSSETDYKEGIAPALERLAMVAAQQSDFAQAARLWGAAVALRKTIGAPLPPIERVGYEQAVAAARSEGSTEGFGATWAEGYALPLERVLAECSSLRVDVYKRQQSQGADVLRGHSLGTATHGACH